MMTDDEVRQLAIDEWYDGGKIEIDSNAIVSRGEGKIEGAYVAAWVWVDFLEDGDLVPPGCEFCLRGDLTLHPCPNADCGCLGIHYCGPTDPSNPPSMEEDELPDPDLPCPECEGRFSHRSNCSRGIAFSDYNKYPGDVAARDTF